MSFSTVELSLTSLRHNIETIRRASHNRKIMFPVKANAYGHGLKEIAEMSDGLVDYYMVATLEEALYLKELGIKVPVFIDMPLIALSDMKEAVLNGFRINLATPYQLELLEKLSPEISKRAIVHVEFDTGMNRTGFKLRDIDALNDFFAGHKYINVEGVFTHFATGIENRTEIQRQNNVFREILKKISFPFRIKHSENSAVLLADEFRDMDMVRTGITLYGLFPSEGYDLDLIPVLSWKSLVVDVKTIEKDEGVSYGFTFRAPHSMKVATVAVGYGDGYPRALSNKGYVLIRGKKLKIIGTICMNHLMVDASRIENIKVGEEVVLIGRQGNEEITADEIARYDNTINYEVVSGISPLLPRVIKQ